MKENIEKEIKELQLLIDDVMDEEVTKFTFHYFEKLELSFITGREHSSIKPYEFEGALYGAENVLEILNSDLTKDIEFFTKLIVILKNILY